MTIENKPIYSLITLEKFKALMGVDDRDDVLVHFCIEASTLAIEQYCKRSLLRKKHFEKIKFTGDLLLPLREFPVSKILAVYQMKNEKLRMINDKLIESEFYCTIPDCGYSNDFPFDLSLFPEIKKFRGIKYFKVIYWAGYPIEKVPADLVSACYELAAWNMNRYRGRRIGMSGNIRGAGIQGEHFEMQMPENVRQLVEPYKRRVI